MRSVFSSLFGSRADTTFPYVLGEAYDSCFGSWTHHKGTSKEDNSSVSIFAFTSAGAGDSRLNSIRNGVKRLRATRHPNIVSFLNSVELEGQGPKNDSVTVYIVTEPVKPLAVQLRELHLSGPQRDEYLSWGLHQVAAAVSFLNNDCKLVHGNVSVSSVVTTPTLDWKLFGFDYMGDLKPAGPDVQQDEDDPFLPFEFLIPSQYKSQELAKGDWALLRSSPTWAIDAWGLGCLVYELFTNSLLSRTEDLRQIGSIPKSLLPEYQRLLAAAPGRRLNPSKLHDASQFFNNKLVNTLQFLESLSIKDAAEKDTFFRRLPSVVDQLPVDLCRRKVFPLLLSGLEFGSAPASALQSLLLIAKGLPKEEYDAKVVPCIVKLFASTDRALRVALLQSIDTYSGHLSNTVVDDQIFPHLAFGFSDTSAFVRELTLKSMVILAPKLSQRTLTQNVLKHLSKLQTDEEAAIRTNTTICIGNIARYLSEASRKKILVNALTRALRDQFPPARAASLMALIATNMFYDATEIATRILPAAAILCIDGDVEVKKQAFRAMDAFVAQLKDIDAGRAPSSGSAADASAPEGAAGPRAQATAAQSESMLSWAVSSLSFGAKKPEAGATTPPQTAQPTGDATVGGGGGGGGGYVGTSAGEKPKPALSGSSQSPPQPARASVGGSPAAGSSPRGSDRLMEDGNGADGGDDDGWGDLDVDVPAPAAPSGSSRPLAARPSSGSSGPRSSLSSAANRGSNTNVAIDGELANILEPATLPKAGTASASAGGTATKGVGRGITRTAGAGRGVARAASGTKPGPMKLGAQRVAKKDPSYDD